MSKEIDRIYVPKAGVRRVDFPKTGGHLLRFSFHAEAMVKFLLDHIDSGEYISENKEGEKTGYIAVNISERREPASWGDTHNAYLDDWPIKKRRSQSELKVEDIPF